MRITWERVSLPIALTLVTAFTVHLLWFPFYGEYYARLRDQHAAQAIRQWYRWNPVFIVGLAAGWAVLYTILRRGGDRPPIIAVVTSGTVLLGIVMLELLLIAAYSYIQYSVFRA